jgi:cardiolipin synthase
MEINYKKKVKLVSATVKIICVLILIYIQVKIYQVQWHGSAIGIRYFDIAIELLKLALVLHIIYRVQSPVYKLLWVILIVFFPVIGAILYLIFGNPEMKESLQKKADEEYINTKRYFRFNNKIYNEVKDMDKLKYNQINYLTKTTGLPLYRNEHIEYLENGEQYFKKMLEEMSKAKMYILLESFSISEGTLWNDIFNVLKQKAARGVKIYLITDDMINSEKYPKDFKKKLEESGIEYRLFNPLTFNVNQYLNYRDHRKMTVIDGRIVFTGGPNIGDEYINAYEKFGHWKDAGVKIIGNAALSYIVNFIRMWNICSENKKLDYTNFIDNSISEENTNNGYIMPYCDGPDNNSNPAENLYIQLINTAKEYLYITTPYLILDNEILTALVNSAKSGVDIRIIIPFIPDKPLVHMATRAFYQILLEAGVRIYEYKPGFMHSKMFVSDDELATVGSINLDFRGLYFHYECGNWIYKTGIESVIKDDFLKEQEKSLEIKLEDWKNRGLSQKLLDKILITFSPLV